ncbi:MAG: serine/threonine protein kinase [Chloroflexota bacterium]
MSDLIGNTLGKVRIESLLARGGMAEVYLGTHTTLQRSVAVKRLLHHHEDDPELLERFQREARVVASLRHPNIVQVLDFDSSDGRPYLVMEFVPGVALSSYLRALHQRGERLEYPLAARLLRDLADALHYAHQSGVIHRDVKPGNILLTARGIPVDAAKPLPPDVQPVLTDFGLVRYLHSASQTATGQIAGTPAYMSPEQARGDRTDTRTDIYSLGIVMYEVLAGRVPFEADSTMGVLLKHLSEPPSPIPGLSPALQTVIDRALAKRPEERFQTPLEFATAFEAALQGRAEAATLLPPDFLPPQPAHRNNPLAWIGAGIAALALGTVFMAVRPQAAVPPTATPSPIVIVHNHEPPATQTPPIAGATPAPVVIVEDVGLVRFADVAAQLDGVIVAAQGMPAPPAGKQYEAWLVGSSGETRRSLGILTLDADGNGSLQFVDDQSRNTLARFDRMEITLEPNPDPSPNPSGEVAFSSGVPLASLEHVRHLLVSLSDTPGQIGLIRGLWTDAHLVDEHANAMLKSFDAGDEAAARRNAEAVVNLIVGRQSEQYGDLDQDGETTDPGDGYGLLLNGESPGYTGGVLSHTNYAMTTGNAPESVLLHGGHVLACTENVERWSVELRDQVLSILAGPFDDSTRGKIVRAVGLADQLVSGIDLNGDERIDPITGEGGVRTAYEHSYYMADILILPGQGQVMPPGPTPSGPAPTPSDYYDYQGGG